MSAEAFARLRWCVDSADQLKEKYTTLRADDIRTALARIEALEEKVAAWCEKLRDDERRHVNAHAALEAKHTEALDALKGLEDGCASVASWSEECLEFSDTRRVIARAVLAKAGRR